MSNPFPVPLAGVALALASAVASAGSLSSGLGATNLHGLDDYNGCMAQTSGALEKLRAQVLGRKLNRSPNLPPQERQHIQQDIEWLKATASGAHVPPPDPKNPQRYFLEMSDAEQMEASGAYNRFASEVREKCEAQYGGMSQFGDPSGARHAPIDTRVALPDLLNATPPSAGAGPATAMQAHRNCVSALPGLRWKLIADTMQQKMESSGGMSAQERKAWEEDIAAVRAAQNGDARTMPRSPDPRNPMRYMTRLSPNEQLAVSQKYAGASQQLLASCSGGPAAAGGSALPASSDDSARLAQMHAERRANAGRSRTPDASAANAAAQAWLDAHPARAPKPGTPQAVGSGGSLSAGLGATQADYLERGGVLGCYDRAKGFRAHQTADKLTTKRATVAAQDRQELESWITAWRQAEQQGRDEPTPFDARNPQGWLRFLSGADQQEINMASSALHNRVGSECASMDYMGIGKKNSKVEFGN